MPKKTTPFNGVYEIKVPYTWASEPDPESRVEGYWNPGVRFVDGDPHQNQADGVGTLVITVLDHYQPPAGYDLRVVFSIQWVNPEGQRSPRYLKFQDRRSFKKRIEGYKGEYWLTPMAEDFVQEAA
jgi:hypothetical protein